MFRHLFTSAICVLALLPLSLHAQQESETRLKLPEAPVQKPADDVDDLITNRQLRAESGSKSRWSIASTLIYNGGTLEKPLAAARPNISGTTGTTDWALLEGQVSGKMNLSARNALMAGVGVRWIAPLESRVPRGYEGERFDADNPYLIFQHLYKWSGVQSVLQLQPTYYTNANLVNEGYVASLLLNQDNMIEFENSKFSLGFSVWAQFGYFNKTGPLGIPGTDQYIADVRAEQSDYQFGFDPVVEYAFNDNWNFRWLANLANFEHLRSQANANTYRMDKVYQSVGLGISLTRDMFLYPNVQFLLNDMRADRTNVALNSNINLF